MYTKLISTIYWYIIYTIIYIYVCDKYIHV